MKLKKIYLEITNTCNLKCPFCIKNNNEKRILSINDFELILDKTKDYTEYLYFHVLGEPLMHPNINEFINIAAAKGFKINITTNGYLINKIKNNKNIRQLNISLHSYTEDANIPLESYLTNIFDSITELTKNNTYISLRMWVKNKHNEKMVHFINNLYNTKINLESYHKINDYIFINPFHEFIWPDVNNDYYSKTGTCYALKDHIGILSDGTIIPCCLDTKGIIKLGNIFKDELNSVLNTPRVKNMMRHFQENEKCEELCRHCNFLNIKE